MEWQKKKMVLLLIKPTVTSTTHAITINTSALLRKASHGNPNAINTSQEDLKILCKQHRFKEVLRILHRTEYPDDSTYASLLQGCINVKALPEAKLVHAHVIETGFRLDSSLATKLVIVYGKCASLVDALQTLNEMPERNVISWTAMIAAYARHGPFEEALRLFYRMQETGIKPDKFTFASVFAACANMAALEHGKMVHEDLIRSGCQSDIFVENALVDMYAKCGSIEKAREVFDRMSERSVVSWTSMIVAYTSHGFGEEALKLFHQMQQTGVQPDEFAFTSVLPALPNLSSLREVHQVIIRSGFEGNVFVGSALIDMYAKFRSIENAHKVYDKMPEGNVVSCNVMVAGYAQNGHVDEALKLFQKMPERNVISWTAMIAGYAQNGLLDDAMKLFEEMPERNVVSWNAMIAGYARNGLVDEAVKLLRQMQLTRVKPNSVTFASVLPACANFAALQQGKEAHDDVIRSGFQSDIIVGNALVDMYAKCGSIEDAWDVFDKMPRRDVVSWTTMIAGYAMHGRGKEALQLFEQMQTTATKPNHVTFIGVLSACCHAGLVDDGWQYFHSMSRDYQITPVLEHYCCMVNLLGRAGHLDEAEDFISKMPIKPDVAVWGSLLGACRIHANVELGERVAERLFELDPKNSAHYVLLSNMYAAAGRWDDIENVRKMMKDRRVLKMPGSSWIEVNKKVNAFLTGDRSHPQSQEIYAKLESLSGQMKETGYAPNTNFVLHDVEEEQKEHILCHHSEKLAIAFGLINTFSVTPIRIIKNLRVCGDCHYAIKFISKIVGREIVVRDTKRFHHFKDGQCSCGDFW
eukprot:Gb_07727 [translate_table: standard]